MFSICVFWLCKSCSILSQLICNSSRIFIRLGEDKKKRAKKSPSKNIRYNLHRKFICQHKQVGTQSLCTCWHPGLIFAAASNHWWDCSTQFTKPAEFLDVCGALELASRVNDCASCWSSFFPSSFCKGKKNVSIFAVILVWLWCWKEKLSLLTSFNNQMSSDPLNFSKCNYNWNVLKSFRQGRRLAWLIWDLLLELRCEKKESLWPLWGLVMWKDYRRAVCHWRGDNLYGQSSIRVEDCQCYGGQPKGLVLNMLTVKGAPEITLACYLMGMAI